MPGDTRKRYPAELKQRAVRMVAENIGEHESEWAAMTRVAELLGVGTPETVRKWVRQAQVDAGSRPGVTTEETAEVRRLKRENAELKRANAILKAAAAFFGAEARPAFPVIVDFIREHADHREPGGLRWGVEPICAVLTEHGLTVAPSTYYEHVGKAPTARQQREEFLLEQIRRVHAANYGVYGARKVWLALNREGVPVARCTMGAAHEGARPGWRGPREGQAHHHRR